MRAVITGASRGIGRATAQRLAADGAEALTLCDIAHLDEQEADRPPSSGPDGMLVQSWPLR
ncbi:MAG: SDR family NAD(P)-dependent oxidoreductase [Alphaproteobacteria bacterium]|nr:SDR family NAD(P)-dependent oxidoreductase [Alphaproteobacteria bacterium]